MESVDSTFVANIIVMTKKIYSKAVFSVDTIDKTITQKFILG